MTRRRGLLVAAGLIAAQAAAVGVVHTADMAERTGDPLWDRLRILIALCALFAGIVAALTPRRPL